MGFQVSRNKKVVSDINITPLVDVMLVLLIIFMISAPMLYNGIKLKLPQTQKVNSLTMNKDQVVLSVSETGEYFIGKQKFLKAELVAELKSLMKLNKQDVIYLRAHYKLAYGLVAKLVSRLKRNGIVNIALVTETQQEES